MHKIIKHNNMKTIKPTNNQYKRFSKYGLTFLFSAIFSINISAKTNIDSDSLNYDLNTEKYKLEKILFANGEGSTTENQEINEIEVFELAEEVQFDFDTSKYLPENFNALAGKNDINWNEIELVELEEDIEINFDTKTYLPNGFDTYKGMLNNIVEIFINQ